MINLNDRLKVAVLLLLSILFGYGAPLLLFPGIPLGAPTHSDIYNYLGIRDWGALQCLNGPRPIGNLLVRILVEFEYPSYMMLACLTSILATAAPFWVVIKSCPGKVSWPGLIAGLLLAFAHPAFLVSSPHDIWAKFAMIFVSISVYYILEFLKNPETNGLFYKALIFYVASGLCKEMYLPAMSLGLLAVSLWAVRTRQGLARYHLPACVLGAALILLVTIKSMGGPFLANEGAYTIAAPQEILKSLVSYIRDAYFFNISWSVVAIFSLGIFLIASPSWRTILGLAACIIASILIFAPTSLLTSHYYAMYTYAVIPFYGALVCMGISGLHNRLTPASTNAILVAGSAILLVLAYKAPANTERISWTLYYAKLNGRTVEQMESISAPMKSVNRLAIFGLDQNGAVVPFSPLVDRRMMQDLWGTQPAYMDVFSRSPGIVVSGPGHRVLSATSKEELAQYDGILVIDGRGNIIAKAFGHEATARFLDIGLTYPEMACYFTTNK